MATRSHTDARILATWSHTDARVLVTWSHTDARVSAAPGLAAGDGLKEQSQLHVEEVHIFPPEDLGDKSSASF